MIRRRPRSTLFPYTTLFRSRRRSRSRKRWRRARRCSCSTTSRSEEHTSELQSRRDLVCRLLLEKKKEVREEAWPDVRDEEELHEVLLTMVALPASANAGPPQNNHLDQNLRASIPAWSEFSEQLAARRRAALAQVGGLKYWVSAERAKDFVQVFPAACFESLL